MSRIIQRQLNASWIRKVGLLAAILFVLQSNAVLCACPSGAVGPMGIASASFGDVACHGSMAGKTCPCKASDTTSRAAKHGADTSCGCHSLAACTLTGSENIAMLSSGAVSPEPVLLTPVILDPEKRLFLATDNKTPFSTASVRRARSKPIYVLNSAFLR